MNNPELQQKIEKLLEELFFVNESIPIIVEGKNDEDALRKLGAKGMILKLNTGLTLLNFVEEIARDFQEVIILTDWDNKGRQLFDRLRRDFQYNSVKTIDNFWFDFKKYCSREIQQVEYLTKFLNN